MVVVRVAPLSAKTLYRVILRGESLATVRDVSSPLTLRFLQSASSHEQLPESITELALVGRSNVGKSSLINALANRKELARTSKTPGATRLLNIYEFGKEDSGRWLVDLPGYGFAKVSKKQQSDFADMIEAYLTHSESLDKVLLLIDGEVGPTELDLQTVDWLMHLGMELQIIATKSDKVKSSKSKKRRTDLAAALERPKGEIMWVSVKSGKGVPELRGEIAKLLNSDPS